MQHGRSVEPALTGQAERERERERESAAIISNGITFMSKFLKTSVAVLKLKHVDILRHMTIHI